MSPPENEMDKENRFYVIFRLLREHSDPTPVAEALEYAENDAIDELRRVVMEVSEEAPKFSTST